MSTKGSFKHAAVEYGILYPQSVEGKGERLSISMRMTQDKTSNVWHFYNPRMQTDDANGLPGALPSQNNPLRLFVI